MLALISFTRNREQRKVIDHIYSTAASSSDRFDTCLDFVVRGFYSSFCSDLQDS